MSNRQPDATLADLLIDASKLADQDDRDFEVLVPFVSVTNKNHQDLAAYLPEWCSPPRASAWFAEHNVKPPRHNGAFRYKVTVKDAVAAARAVATLV